jgi:hypothetical protein
MEALDNSGSTRGLRRWWRSPPRTGLRRLINPWEYRHLRLSGGTRVGGAGVGTIAAIICLSYSADGWAAFFLALAGLNLAGGYWYLSIARSEAARGGA